MPCGRIRVCVIPLFVLSAKHNFFILTLTQAFDVGQMFARVTQGVGIQFFIANDLGEVGFQYLAVICTGLIYTRGTDNLTSLEVGPKLQMGVVDDHFGSATYTDAWCHP